MCKQWRQESLDMDMRALPIAMVGSAGRSVWTDVADALSYRERVGRYPITKSGGVHMAKFTRPIFRSYVG